MNPFSIKQFHKDPERVALAAIIIALVLAPDSLYVQVVGRVDDTIIQSLLLALFGGSFFVRGASAIGKGLAASDISDAARQYE